MRQEIDQIRRMLDEVQAMVGDVPEERAELARLGHVFARQVEANRRQADRITAMLTFFGVAV